MKTNFYPQLHLSSYASSYGCGSTEPVHTCHDCPEAREREFARTRSSFFVKKGYLATLLATPTTLATWTTGITNNNIIIIPNTSGSYDPGDPKELKGYGDRSKSYGPRTQKLVFNDPDYADNYHFYNEIVDRDDYVPGFRTSSMVRIFDVPASIKAKDPVADDLEEEVVWQCECEVISKNLPVMVPVATIASVFSCSNF